MALACKKDEKGVLIYDAGPQDTGSCSAKRGGRKWNSTADGWVFPPKTKKYVGIRFTTYEGGALREDFSLGGMLAKEGKYEIRGNPFTGEFAGVSLGIMESDGDLFGALYQSDSTATGSYVKITRFDTIKHVLEGEFNEINLVRVVGGSLFYPEKLTYKKGKFKTQLDW